MVKSKVTSKIQTTRIMNAACFASTVTIDQDARSKIADETLVPVNVVIELYFDQRVSISETFRQHLFCIL